jgi:hypothetical protein
MRRANQQNGNEQQKTALEERNAAQEPTHKTEPEEQREGESISETRRPSLSKSGGQHERCEKAAEEKVREERLKAAGLKARCGCKLQQQTVGAIRLYVSTAIFANFSDNLQRKPLRPTPTRRVALVSRIHQIISPQTNIVEA